MKDELGARQPHRPGDLELLIETVLRDIPAALTELLRRKLMQLTCVIRVEMHSVAVIQVAAG
jgi:hypothetical protein